MAIDVASSCSNRFLEGYTAILPPEQEDKLREIIGDWEKIMRPRVEQPDELLELARNDSVALLIVISVFQSIVRFFLGFPVAFAHFDSNIFKHGFDGDLGIGGAGIVG